MPHAFFHFSFSIALLLIFIAIAASFIDTLAGGGSLISVPALLLLGFPAVFALGTSKFQSSIGEMNASFHFIRSKRIDVRTILPGILFIAIGSTLGTILIQSMNSETAEKVIPWLLLGIVLYTYFSPRFTSLERVSKMPSRLFFMIFGFSIGFYNGFLGPGTGAFWVFALMFFLGFSFIDASIHAKPLNMLGSLFSLAWFIVGHHVLYVAGITMAIGQLIGSRIGAHCVLMKGAPVVRPVYLFVVTTMVVVLFAKMIG